MPKQTKNGWDLVLSDHCLRLLAGLAVAVVLLTMCVLARRTLSGYGGGVHAVRTYTHAQAIYTHAQANMHLTYTHTLKHTRAWIHIRIDILTHTCILVHMYTLHTCMFTHIHAHMHTRSHAYTYSFSHMR